MIVDTALPWQAELQKVITDPSELWQILELPQDLLPAAYRAAELFPLKAPRPLVARMTKGNVEDPLLRQVLPLTHETGDAHSLTDPYQENQSNPHPGLLHKYQHRVLLIATGTCAVNCRYCFRRHFPYEENNPGRIGWQRSLHYIAADDTITEVILSGGDPLAANDQLIAWFVEQLSLIPHVQIIRFHTRLPIVIPQRITAEFLHTLTSTRLTPVMVIHANHAQEIDNDVQHALLQMKNAGITLLNQSVLLRGVNDSADVLQALSYRLFQCGVLPYYLHQCDPVKGTGHFVVEDDVALTLHQQMKQRLPGYLVPRLVREKAGELSKVWLV